MRPQSRTVEPAVLVVTPWGDSGCHAQVVTGVVPARKFDAIDRLAHHDELTGLLNRRGLRLRATALFDEARRRDRGIAFLFADVDGLKAVNDRRGHPAGDDVLRRAAQPLRQCFRDIDAISRYGGDEFCVVAVTRSTESTRRLAQRVDHCLDQEPRGDGYEGPPLQMTVGVVHVDDPGSVTPDAVIHQADASMYRARTQKRPDSPPSE